MLQKLQLPERKIKVIVLTERTELLVPLTYMCLTLMAYYGPNADILGSIKLKIWHYETVIENIEKFVLNLLSLFFIDVISFAINGILIWHFCKLNVLEVINNLQKSFWLVFTVSEALLLLEVIYEKWGTLFWIIFIYITCQITTGFSTTMHWKWTWSYSRIWMDWWKIHREFIE